MAKLSASGEWLVAGSDVPSSGPVELKQNTKLRSGAYVYYHWSYGYDL